MFALLKPYKAQVLLLALIGLIANGLNLLIPELIGDGINSITIVHGLEERLLVRFAAVILAVLVLATLQNLIQVHAGEQVAFDLRKRLSEKLSRQSYAFLVAHDRSRLLTNLTSDVDAVKVFVSQVIAGLISSAVVITGASILLLRLNTRVGLAVLMIVPLVGVTFYVVLKSVRPLFKEGRILIDSLNRVIEENVVGAALIRVLNVGQKEEEKFSKINQKARELGLKILAHFTFMSPAATFFSNVATLIILTLGGWQVLGGQMRVGDIAAFNSYLALLIFPIFVIGFMGNLISSAQASYVRIEAVLNAPEPKLVAKSGQTLGGGLQARELFLSYGEKDVLKGISFSLKPATRTAIVGPTAAGKTQLIHLLSGLLEPSRGEILYDDSLSPQMLGHQIGVVFQESALFYASLRDNIVMNAAVKEDGLARAIETAELKDFVQSLPEGLDTLVSERGTTLSGGQKQRVMLARALALEPQVLLLDDFTARLDPTTEAKVHLNLEQNYPGLTILTVTQRISSVVDFDHIMLVMEGQLIAQGTHHELLEQSPEYMQIFESQKSIQQYA